MSKCITLSLDDLDYDWLMGLEKKQRSKAYKDIKDFISRLRNPDQKVFTDDQAEELRKYFDELFEQKWEKEMSR